MSTQPIKHEYIVHCSPEHAFDVYARQLGSWWPPAYTADATTFAGVQVDGRVGGAVVELHGGGERYQWGEVTAWQPVERLSYTSTLAQNRECPSEITVTFHPHEDGCRVIFEHGGWNEENASDRRKFGDWPLILAGFVALAERAPTASEDRAVTPGH